MRLPEFCFFCFFCPVSFLVFFISLGLFIVNSYYNPFLQVIFFHIVFTKLPCWVKFCSLVLRLRVIAPNLPEILVFALLHITSTSKWLQKVSKASIRHSLQVWVESLCFCPLICAGLLRCYSAEALCVRGLGWFGIIDLLCWMKYEMPQIIGFGSELWCKSK